ncbi:hypothetical protein CPB84DRAFT_1823638, partial [Gymnopilus junonius]
MPAVHHLLLAFVFARPSLLASLFCPPLLATFVVTSVIDTHLWRLSERPQGQNRTTKDKIENIIKNAKADTSRKERRRWRWRIKTTNTREEAAELADQDKTQQKGGREGSRKKKNTKGRAKAGKTRGPRRKKSEYKRVGKGRARPNGS